jgi:lysophospholipase L1-like esterase
MPTLVPRAGTYRILCLGDSNVALAGEPYPQRIQKLLDAASPGRFEVINAGVPGYTSLQGLRLLEGRASSYAPRLVTVQFGWNDHWMADKPLSQKVSRERVAFGLRERLRRSRIYQLGLYARTHLTRAAQRPEDSDYQVPPNEYREYLKRMVALGHERGFEVMLLTVPSNFKLEKLAPFARVGFTPGQSNPKWKPEGLIRVHAELNDIVRAVAASQSAVLVDLEAIFADLPERDDYFLQDAIHFSPRGHQFVAETLARVVAQHAAVASRTSVPRLAAGSGRYDLSDPRVVLKNFSPLEATLRDPQTFSAALRDQSELLIVGLRPAAYGVSVCFTPDDVGSSLMISTADGQAEQTAVIDAQGCASAARPSRPDASGVLRIHLRPSIPMSAQAERGRVPSLVAIELSDRPSTP